jgi:hypothetical protein
VERAAILRSIRGAGRPGVFGIFSIFAIVGIFRVGIAVVDRPGGCPAGLLIGLSAGLSGGLRVAG